MTERKDDTMELPLDDLEEEVKPGRKGPPPLPKHGGSVEPAESTTPTEVPPPPSVPPSRPSGPPSRPSGPPSRPPARLGKSVLPPAPAPATFKMKSPAEVKTARQRDSSAKATRRLKFKPGELPFDAEKPKTSTRPSAPPPPTAAALRLSSKPPPSSKKPPPLKTAKVSRPPAPTPKPSKPASIRTAVTRPGTAATTSVGEAAKVARIRFLEEELRDLKSRIADHTRRVTARLDALAVRVEKLEGTQSRATLIDQRVDEMGEDVEERLDALEKRVEALHEAPEEASEEKDAQKLDAPTQKMVAPPPSLDELEVSLLEKLSSKIEAEVAARIAELPSSTAAAGATKKKPSKKKKKDADPLTEVKGIGPANAKKLRKRGMKTPADVAAWSDADIESLHSTLGIATKRLREWRTAAQEL